MKTDLNSKRWLLRTRSVYVRLLCTLLLLLCNSVMLLAQGVSVSGVVVDLNGESLPGVKISPFLFIFHHLTYIRKSLYYSAF